MKRILLALLLTMLLAAPCFAGIELRGNVGYFMPSESGFDGGIGVEGQCVYWNTPELGFAGSVGWYSLGGGSDFSIIPIGVSAIYRPKLNLNIPGALEFEGGLRYVMNNYSDTYDFGYLGSSYKIKSEIDSSICGLLAVNYSMPIQKNLKFYGSLGYQFGIVTGDWNVTVSGSGLEGYGGSGTGPSMGGFLLRAGLAMGL
jgi:hypothetical protein